MKVLYYFLYKILIKSRREEDPGGATAIILGFTFFWNIIILLKMSFPSGYFNMPKEQAVFIGIFVGIIFFVPIYFFLYKRRDKIITDVESFSKKRYLIGKVVSYSYFLVTIIFTFYYLFTH
ncbi:hypothetical protein [Pedobacter sp. SL55]|uniref:hypothetical protein n=1 Tax=Pedobacter sp. SL55 TaxID=2995161 RepID=UPI00227094D5|nr:hypothetical protein [Pedobacter sp. SL55]WAC42291.1 hypothetical protein OVA16_08030 [Pedobacter sp. SL55]